MTSSGIQDGSAYDGLPELMDAERAMETLAAVMRQRMILATAGHRATAKGKADGERARSAGATLAWRRHLSDDLESVAKRLSVLSPQFMTAVDEADRTFRALVVRSASGGLTAQDRTDVDEALEAVLDAVATIAAAPRPENPENAPMLQGVGLRRARRAWDSIVAEMESQWRQVQALRAWTNLVQETQARGIDNQ
ncbi:hypothetical protein acdb102_16220 [Acidothermaceae bacterium B102]|nr:hypothetical protein acdb102_16220 [Acidothermaceae bacterium B102]